MNQLNQETKPHSAQATQSYKVSDMKTLDEFMQHSNKHNIPLFMKFGAEWCGPCKRIQPFYEQMASNYSSAVFVHIDIDEFDGISEMYNIKSLPTFSVFKDGRYQELLRGSNPQKLQRA
ncbi:unnamed protein product, partial [marine sediment metagenome]